jgi:hypothetical protein
MRNQALFPMVALREAAVSVSFGAPGQRPICELPFRARLLDDAAAPTDVAPAKVMAPKNGKYEVVFPVGLPGEGTYDFLDFEFYPSRSDIKFVEVSQRAINSALVQSGQSQSGFDIGRMLEVYKMVASTKKRHVVVMDVKKNLMSPSRVADLTKFWKAPWFLKRAVVAVGTPPKDFTKKVKDAVLEKESTKLKYQVDNEKKVWESNHRAKKEELEKKAAADKLKAAAAGEKYEAPGMDEAEAEPDWSKKMTPDPALVKDVTFRPPPQTDIESNDLVYSFPSFSLPVDGPREVVDKRWLPKDEEPPAASGGEGFDEVEYVWQKKAAAEKYFKAWTAEKKVEELYAGLQPTAFCKEAMAEFTKLKTAMRDRSEAYSAEVEKRKAAKAKAEAAAAAPAPEEKPAEEAKAEEKAEETAEAKTEEPKSPKKEEAEGVKEEPKAESGDVEMAPAGEEKTEKAEESLDMTVDDDAAPVAITAALDVESIDGKKTPLYKAWALEDWALMTMRAELHILLRSFKADVTEKDAERRGITTKHLGFYYSLFLQKSLDPTSVGMPSQEKLLEYLSDVVTVTGGVLALKSSEDLPLAAFVKETESRRRDREKKLLAGDDSARLEFRGKGYQNQGKGYQNQGKGYQNQDKGKGYQNQWNKGAQAKGGPAYAPSVPYKGGGQQPYGQKRPADNDYAAKRPRPYGAPAYGGGYGGKGFPAYGKGK